MERLSYVVIVMVYGMVRLAGRRRRIVGMLIIGSVCYRKSLTWCCEAVRDVLRVGFASVGVGVGACDSMTLGGVCRGKAGGFWRVVWWGSGGVVDCEACGVCRLALLVTLRIVRGH